jgi:hypothetical protein
MTEILFRLKIAIYNGEVVFRLPKKVVGIGSDFFENNSSDSGYHDCIPEPKMLYQQFAFSFDNLIITNKRQND